MASLREGLCGKSVQQKDCERTISSNSGSLDNIKHKPGGGGDKVTTKKVSYDRGVTSKVGSLDNIKHKPGGGGTKIRTYKLNFDRVATSKVGSLDNVKHKPGGGGNKIETFKLNFDRVATSKIGSLDNIKHKAGGGGRKIHTHKVNFDRVATSKIGSLENIKHKPGGAGACKIRDYDLTYRSRKIHLNLDSQDNINPKSESDETNSFNENSNFDKSSKPKLESSEHSVTSGGFELTTTTFNSMNLKHKPSGGVHMINDNDLIYRSREIHSNIGTPDTTNQKPVNRETNSFTEKFNFDKSSKPEVESSEHSFTSFELTTTTFESMKRSIC